MTLSFWHWIEAHYSTQFPGYALDGGIVEIRTDGGEWEQIYPEGGYDYLIARMTTPPGPFPNDTPCFSGSHDWEEVEFDLGEFSGTAEIRFRFGTDASTGQEGWYIDDVRIEGFLVNPAAVPETEPTNLVLLHPADPNPATGETYLRYELGAAGNVRLALFDPTGRLVRVLAAGARPAGVHKVLWDGRDDQSRPVAPGVYFFTLQAGGETDAGKVIVTR
jgi:hypothetical protein